MYLHPKSNPLPSPSIVPFTPNTSFKLHKFELLSCLLLEKSLFSFLLREEEAMEETDE